jgi:hypothetical protein
LKTNILIRTVIRLEKCRWDPLRSHQFESTWSGRTPSAKTVWRTYSRRLLAAWRRGWGRVGPATFAISPTEVVLDHDKDR